MSPAKPHADLMCARFALTPKRHSVGLGVAVSWTLFLMIPPVSLGANVIASTSDLAAIAKEIGGDHITVESLCRPNQDPHSFEILPQHVIAVQTADLYLRVGAGLDFWSDELLGGIKQPG